MTTTDSRSAAAARAAGATILVIEDDAALRSFVVDELRAAGHRADGVATGAEARFRLEDAPPDLAILDLGLPDEDGLDLLRSWGGRSDVEILILSARDGLDDRIAGLYAGAGDYLVKPFETPELLARVHARLRAGGGGDELRYGDLRLAPDAARLSGPGGSVALAARELELLRVLMRHPDRLYARDELERRLYSPGREPGSNTVEVFVHRVRKRLDAVGSRVRIRTVRGRGYLLASTGR